MPTEEPSTRSGLFGLTAQTIEKIVAVFKRHPAIEKALLYGSRAKGNYRQGSDIDLTLAGDELTHAELNRVNIELDDLLLPYKIDLSLLSHIDSPDLIEHINRVGAIFYQNQPAP
ncbi:nucleotidyltransferase domain-containing protein [Romeria aff. gracilis LEGE 07310]|uniref:Nucleotidyltransferase domain-containing protein n=1 Tax=Vasconcelosia minhoensis LEGE 07310 TaxID=915328 RepID=A0A8J7ALY2_9CYAN|nr:nucleotidyltransferase domain-containing protein [Romeria gracilis]MBE9077415.1 nucleotidyltransferase domain-containing protein [Romeria aff. gracilis LEGE 07310]